MGALTREKESNKPTQKTTETNTSADTVGAKQKVGKRIKIGSLNIQNIRGNTIFAQSVMKETEILFIAVLCFSFLCMAYRH
jgi:hypothetical protein